MLKICHMDPVALKKPNPLKNPSENPRREVDLMVWMLGAWPHHISKEDLQGEGFSSVSLSPGQCWACPPVEDLGFSCGWHCPVPIQVCVHGLVCVGRAGVSPGSLALSWLLVPGTRTVQEEGGSSAGDAA